MFSIDDFKAQVSKGGGLAQSNLYWVTLPEGFGSSARGRELDMLCTDIQLPGQQITTQIRQEGLRTKKVAYGYMQEDVSATFLNLNNYQIKKYFENWMRATVRDDITHEVMFKKGTSGNDGYARQVKIRQLKKGIGIPVYKKAFPVPKLPSEIQNRLPKIGPFDFAQGELDLNFMTKDKIVYECTLHNAFPTTMNPIQLSNTGEGQQQLNIQFSYDHWTSSFPNDGSSSIKDTFLSAAIGGIASRLF